MRATQQRPTPGTHPEPQHPAAPSPRPWGRWALAAGLAAAFVIAYLAGLTPDRAWDYIRTHRDQLKDFTDHHLPLALILYFLAYAAVTSLSLPVAAVLSLAAGALFGRWLGTGVVALAATLGATFAFLSSRYVFRDAVRRRFGARLDALNAGVDRDGPFYLFTLRLVPLFPFFLVNLGMGLTRMRVLTYAWVSFLGMLPGTFVYVNAGTALGTLDSPRDILSPGVLASFALLGLLPLALRMFLRYRHLVHPRVVLVAAAVLLGLAAAAAAARTYFRYRTRVEMVLPVREFDNAEYPEDPAERSVRFGAYNGRTLRLIQKDDTHFDYVLDPIDPRSATITFEDVDASLLTPGLPEWAKADPGLVRIALTDRQWNRQQVAFGKPGSPHVRLAGGDGWERDRLESAELAKNCLNAGLWEVLLFTREGGEKALYYQGWFTFPLGHYAHIFEQNTGLPYWRHWYYLEHWFDPIGTPLPLDGLRKVTAERAVPATFDSGEPILAAGEQVRKRRTVLADNLISWGDFYDGRAVRFATFVPPGRYSVARPWKNEFWRLARLERAFLRNVRSPAGDRTLNELELVFADAKGEPCRFLVSGFDLAALPRLPAGEYTKGLYMPMGIGTPPFFQSYDELQKTPPDRSPYFSLMLDAKGKWVNHHDVAVDGPVLYRDAADPDRLHIHLLSYERHTLINHVILSLKE